MLLLLGCLDDLTIFVDHSAHGVLLPDLLYLGGVRFDFLPRSIDLCAKLLASRIFIFQESPILLHSFIFAVGLPEDVKGTRSISQDFHAAVNWRRDHLVCFDNLLLKASIPDPLRLGIGLVQFKFNAAIFN